MVAGPAPTTQRVLITGAASGIGLAVSQTFAQSGWSVTGLDRSARPESWPGQYWITCDLGDEGVLDGALTVLGAQSWSALISCAGMAGVGDRATVLKVNFLAAKRLVETLLPHIADHGAVVLISSGAGIKWPGRVDLLRPVLDAATQAQALAHAVALSATPAAAYRISKELLSFYGARICLREMARGVRVNVVSPGGVETPLIPDFTRSMGAEAMDFSRSVTQRYARPQEIADTVFYLCSEKASWVNGAEIQVDGGLTGALNAGVADFPGWR